MGFFARQINFPPAAMPKFHFAHAFMTALTGQEQLETPLGYLVRYLKLASIVKSDFISSGKARNEASSLCTAIDQPPISIYYLST
jgi:hypothetical protein